MTSANLELVRSIYAAWERGDFSNAGWAHPEIEYVVTDGPHPGGWIGIAAMADSLLDELKVWDEFSATATGLRELDDERVLALVQFRARGKSSAVEVKRESAEVFHVRGGRVTRLVAYWDRDRALAELGLAPESVPSDLVGVAHRQLEAVNRRDLDALMEAYASDVVYDTSEQGLGVYEGTEAMRTLIRGYWDVFEDLTFELDELLDLGGGVTFHVVHQRARPVGSSHYVENREAHISEWSEGKVAKVRVYLDVDEGRAAAERLARERGSRRSDG